MASFGCDVPTVLVANRGEIAVRILRTLRRLSMRSVAVYSGGDSDAPHVGEADDARRIGGRDLADSYLNGPGIIAAASASGATMIHPGYGFLSENADFARACAEAGLTFVGPLPEAIEAMGDKIRAKRTVAAAGVPLLPGFAEHPGSPMADAELAEAASEAGYPLLIKPSAGGGGKGLRLVRAASELAGAAAAARREARAAFGDATLLVERFIERPRHIEVQVLADTHGNVVHLGERECSLQRRHQKIIEEAPSPLLTEAQRAAMGEAAVAAAKSCGYTGAGTVEFIVAAPGHRGAGQEETEGLGEPLNSSEADTAPPSPPGTPGLWTTAGREALPYFFLEMNTRLQVEHPVTEAVASIDGTRGIDLVELQMRIASGYPLPFTQASVALTGHAVEARVYAEDPVRGFLPTGGPVLLLSEPTGAEVRVDSGLRTGTEITSDYDPMLAKVIAWAPDRSAALHKLDAALADYTVLGCTSNVAFLRRLLRHPEVAAGDLSTELTERARPTLVPEEKDEVPREVYVAAALDSQIGLAPRHALASRFDIPDGWRIGEHAWTSWRLRAPGHDTLMVNVRQTCPASGGFEVAIGGEEPEPATAARSSEGTELVVGYFGRTLRYARAPAGQTLWLGREGAAWQLHEQTPLAALTAMHTAKGTGDGTVRSPMPGTVLAVHAAPDQRVSAGTPLLVIEAMKMEHTVSAPIDGMLTRIQVRPGQSVAMDAELATVSTESED